MPYFRLETNVPNAQIRKDLTQELCKVVSSLTERPLELCVASVIGDVDMSWGGKNEPAAQATFTAIERMGVEQNKKFSKVLYDVVCKELKISPERMYVKFIDVAASDVGYKGTTFHEIFK